MEILESQNKDYGFYGTAALHGRGKAGAKWKAAFLWVAAAMPSWSPENIRDFLDGRPGRHLADELHCRGDMGKISPDSWLRSMYEFAVEVGIADKTPGLDLRLKADAEFRKAVASARAAEDVYWKILNGLPSEQKDTPYTAALREHVSDRIARIRLLLHDL